MKACFMGLGYIGLPTSIIAAKHGVKVVGVDINPQVVEMTNQGRLHIIEPGMKEMLQEVVNNGCLHASNTPEVSDAYFMVVPTPFKGDHEPDISYVESATRIAEKDYTSLNKMFIANNKFILYLLMMVAIPLMSELRIIFGWWLGNVSEEAIIYTRLTIIYMLCFSMHNPVTTIVHSTGQLKYYSLFVDSIVILCLPE